MASSHAVHAAVFDRHPLEDECSPASGIWGRTGLRFNPGPHCHGVAAGANVVRVAQP